MGKNLNHWIIEWLRKDGKVSLTWLCIAQWNKPKKKIRTSNKPWGKKHPGQTYDPNPYFSQDRWRIQVRHTIATLALALSEEEGWLQALGLLLSRPSLSLSCLLPFCFISVGQTTQLPWALSHGQEQQDHYLSYMHSGRKAPVTKSGFVNMTEFWDGFCRICL